MCYIFSGNKSWFCLFVFFFKQKTAYEMRISDWSSDVCSSDLERGAAPGLGLHPDAPAHQFDDALGNRQAQAGAAIQAGGGGVGLAEGLEQPALRLLRDADAGVADLEAQLVLGGGLAGPGHVDRDRAALGELHRVADQVAQHLAPRSE